MELSWETLSWNELSTSMLYDLLRLRSEVFVLEQTCVYLDPDGKDQNAVHVMATHAEELIAYARVLPVNDGAKTSIGRVVISQKHRGKKIGDVLMQQCLAAGEKFFPGKKIEMSAQKHLTKYYQKHGFQTVGEPYLEDGIPHIKMIN